MVGMAGSGGRYLTLMTEFGQPGLGFSAVYAASVGAV